MAKNKPHIIPSIVTAYMAKFGCNNAKFLTSNDDGDIFSLSRIDKDGYAMPIGLPIFIIIKDDNVSIIDGVKALKYQDSLSLDD